MLMIVNELKRLNDNQDKIIEFYKKNQDRFIENRNKIRRFTNNKIDIKFFNSIV